MFNMLMSTQRITLLFLRIALGWMYLYAGFTQVTNPKWTAQGYLQGAKVFSGFYQWLASPAILPVLNVINEWGLVILGISLLLGVFVRASAPLGILLMILYYVPILHFPYVGAHSYLVDEHVMYIAGLSVLWAFGAGRVFGLDSFFSRRKK